MFWSSYQMFSKHLFIHYVIIMMKIMIFKVVKCSSIENVNGIRVVFTILLLKNGFSKLIKNENIL